jgi:translation elongation factor EF-1alpha
MFWMGNIALTRVNRLLFWLGEKISKSELTVRERSDTKFEKSSEWWWSMKKAKEDRAERETSKKKSKAINWERAEQESSIINKTQRS